MSFRPVHFLSAAEAQLLEVVLARRDSDLCARLRRAETVSRSDAERVVTVLGDELVNNLDDEWEPTEYGRAVSALQSRFNTARIEEWG